MRLLVATGFIMLMPVAGFTQETKELPETVTVKINDKGIAEILGAFKNNSKYPLTFSAAGKPENCEGFWSKDWKTFASCKGGVIYQVEGQPIDPAGSFEAKARLVAWPKPGDGTDDPGPDKEAPEDDPGQ